MNKLLKNILVFEVILFVFVVFLLYNKAQNTRNNMIEIEQLAKKEHYQCMIDKKDKYFCFDYINRKYGVKIQ